jgi:hypothetical protein
MLYKLDADCTSAPEHDIMYAPLDLTYELMRAQPWNSNTAVVDKLCASSFHLTAGKPTLTCANVLVTH